MNRAGPLGASGATSGRLRSVMHSVLERIAASAARDSRAAMSPVTPPVAFMMPLTIALLSAIREALRNGSCRSRPARKLPKSSLSRQRGSSSPGKLLGRRYFFACRRPRRFNGFPQHLALARCSEAIRSSIHAPTVADLPVVLNLCREVLRIFGICPSGGRA